MPLTVSKLCAYDVGIMDQVLALRSADYVHVFDDPSTILHSEVH